MDHSAFRVPPWLHLAGGWVHHFPRFWLALGRLESHLLADRIQPLPLLKPIFVCGLARSGSTLLHEMVAAQPGIATQRVKDYPMVFTPFWWRQATRRHRATTPRERAHGDGMLLTSESPDALEEMIWAAFFPRCHDPSVSNLLGEGCLAPAFETFYRAHLRKLLLAEEATRYAAKANYHVARLAYLLKLFPDARIIIPVREPASHIVSLMRQQQRFSEGQRRYRSALAHMRRSGHFEFGLDRRPINLGDTAAVRAVEGAWRRGEEVRGWALYWAMVHDHLARQLASDSRLRAASVVVPFETLCDQPADTLTRVFSHSDLPINGPLLNRLVPQVRRPDYYRQTLSSEETALVREATGESAARWGYT